MLERKDLLSIQEAAHIKDCFNFDVYQKIQEAIDNNHTGVSIYQTFLGLEDDREILLSINFIHDAEDGNSPERIWFGFLLMTKMCKKES